MKLLFGQRYHSRDHQYRGRFRDVCRRASGTCSNRRLSGFLTSISAIDSYLGWRLVVAVTGLSTVSQWAEAIHDGRTGCCDCSCVEVRMQQRKKEKSPDQPQRQYDRSIVEAARSP